MLSISERLKQIEQHHQNALFEAQDAERQFKEQDFKEAACAVERAIDFLQLSAKVIESIFGPPSYSKAKRPTYRDWLMKKLEDPEFKKMYEEEKKKLEEQNGA